MYNPIIQSFEKAVQSFISNPCKETYDNYMKNFKKLIDNKVDVVIPIVYLEDFHPFQDPTLKAALPARIAMDNGYCYGFYTNKELLKAHSKDAEYIETDLSFLEKTISNNDTALAIIVNPSNDANATIRIQDFLNFFK